MGRGQEEELAKPEDVKGKYVKSMSCHCEKGKGESKDEVSILCCFSGSAEGILPSEQVMEKLNLTDKSPLSIC